MALRLWSPYFVKNQDRDGLGETVQQQVLQRSLELSHCQRLSSVPLSICQFPHLFFVSNFLWSCAIGILGHEMLKM